MEDGGLRCGLDGNCRLQTAGCSRHSGALTEQNAFTRLVSST